MSILQEKVDAYNLLVNMINTYDDKKLKEMQLVPCKACNEVNFWAYWEGGRTHLDADILMVGQDWGSIDYSDEPISGVMRENSSDLKSFCYMKNNKNTTNQNICDLLQVMFPTVDFRKDCNTQAQLFFTNFVPWYREAGANISGGYDKSWKEPSTEFFRKLVSIIEPKIIMCLGRKTYNNVCDALYLHGVKKGKNYTEIIENGCHEVLVGTHSAYVFPLMHPGYWGTRVRPLDKQMEDWKKVREQLEKID